MWVMPEELQENMAGEIPHGHKTALTQEMFLKVQVYYKDGWSQIDFCYYKDGCADSGYGIGGSSSDTENQCIKAVQAGTNNAVITAEVTINGTTYSADTSTVISLLNAWVRANNTDGLYCEWETGENHWPKLKIE